MRPNLIGLSIVLCFIGSLDNNFDSKLIINTAFAKAIANFTNTDSQTVYFALNGNELQALRVLGSDREYPC